MSVRLQPLLQLDLPLAQLDERYREQVGWADAFRINRDARLLLLGVELALQGGGLTEPALRDAALVMGVSLASVESYRSFELGLRAGQLAPLAYSNALPSIPLACVAMRWRTQGPTYTLCGRADVGLAAVAAGRQLLLAGRAPSAIVGSWRLAEPAAVGDRRAGRARLSLVRLDAAPEARRTT
ncbi:hypothetical protein KAK06_03210 [Ideonella sp. 4Y11]|uniref:Beta-ketoacyl synthase-like N-terminal domain-containing protein n=1 Tax=Ideonella aquatica TaxID=2824119 RepID=A0A941BJX2_9BURK|nr:beta-ketoacyl synthase N-terminal-like domain-containing protein [Ideonella aquatica]MBQ0957959.1 hypothetical protein [Ideonella aquatica]